MRFSHEIGVNKPEPQAYRLALEAMGASPEAVLFVDNRAQNVDAARALGIAAVLHRDNRSTIAAINDHLTRGAVGGADVVRPC